MAESFEDLLEYVTNRHSDTRTYLAIDDLCPSKNLNYNFVQPLGNIYFLFLLQTFRFTVSLCTKKNNELVHL